jgi:hypothetical protein
LGLKKEFFGTAGISFLVVIKNLVLFGFLFNSIKQLKIMFVFTPFNYVLQLTVFFCVLSREI